MAQLGTWDGNWHLYDRHTEYDSINGCNIRSVLKEVLLISAKQCDITFSSCNAWLCGKNRGAEHVKQGKYLAHNKITCESS